MTTYPIASWDLETTGISVFADRIVTCSIVYLDGDGNTIQTYEWLVNPEIDIPQGASDVHGITTAMAKAGGMDSKTATEQINSILGAFLDAGVPLVAYNGAYDFSLLESESRRHGLEPLGDKIREKKLIIDPMVIDKTKDKYRKGKRTLTRAAEVYGVVLENAHTSEADCLAAGLIAQKLLVKYPELIRHGLEGLYDTQVMWYRVMQEGLESYFLSKQANNPDDWPDPIEVSKVWPIRYPNVA